ncbi:MAG: homoserine O-acetyltransferase [Candidatus Eisenbacteria bacterium]
MSAYDGRPDRRGRERADNREPSPPDAAPAAAPHFLPCGTDVGRLGAGGRQDVLRLDAPFVTESGEAIAGAELAYRTWGRLSNAADNAVVVCHALTGSSDLEAWWPALLGQGRALDPDRDFVIAVDALGSVHGSTGPASLAADGEPWGRRFPRLSVRDLVRSQRLVLDALGVRGVALVLGGSLGGMQALEWALLDARVRAVAVVAAPARHEAWAMGWSAAQRQALAADPAWEREPFEARAGLAAARAIAMLSYRAPAGFDERFGRRRGDRHDYAVADWLAHHGEALVRRFDPLSYAVLLDAMDSHDIGRSRGGVGPALASLRVPLLAVAIESDQLYPVDEVEQLVQGAPLAEQDQLRSPHGHDAFLIDQRVVESIVRRFRERLMRRERERAAAPVPRALHDPGAHEDHGPTTNGEAVLVRRLRTSGLSAAAPRPHLRTGVTTSPRAEALARAVHAHDARARLAQWPAYRAAGGAA